MLIERRLIPHSPEDTRCRGQLLIVYELCSFAPSFFSSFASSSPLYFPFSLKFINLMYKHVPVALQGTRASICSPCCSAESGTDEVPSGAQETISFDPQFESAARPLARGRVSIWCVWCTTHKGKTAVCSQRFLRSTRACVTKSKAKRFSSLLLIQ